MKGQNKQGKHVAEKHKTRQNNNKNRCVQSRMQSQAWGSSTFRNWKRKETD